MNATKMAVLLAEEVKGLSTRFDSNDYNNALDDAQRETWDLPVTTDFRIYWVKERAKRHLFFYLWTEYVDKIHHEETKFNQRFDHLGKVIEKMDAAFVAIQDARPDEFSNVDNFEMFGTYIRTGFRYDDVGRDVTYAEDSNEPEFSPNESD